jgi:PST family polysaccharide transporter
MRISGSLDVAGKIIATGSIFFLVHQPSDGWKVMIAQATGCVIAHGIAVGMAYAEVGFRLPGRSLVWRALSMGWTLFLFRASQSMLTNINGVILGYLASPAALGLYVGADKIGQASRQCLWPLTQALFPHQSQAFQRDYSSGLRIVRRSLKILGGLGICSGLVVVFAAPLLVRIALGPSFAAAVPTLRILGLLTPLTAIGAVLGFQWMLPLGMDREFNITFFVCGVIHIALAAVFTWRFGSPGMAAAVVLSQALIVCCFIFFLVQRHAASRRLVPVEEVEEQPVESLV